MKVIIVGGGASGMMAAIYSKNEFNNVTIIEKNNNCGKKILLTGAGKCNYFNEYFNTSCFNSNNTELLNKFINTENSENVIKFFNSIGITSKIVDGYYYPYSGTAFSIQNALLLECKRLNINIITNEEVVDITDKYVLTNKKYYYDKLVLATGSIAHADTNGLELLKKYNIKTIPFMPALVQLKGEGNYFHDWAGIRATAKLSLYVDNKFIKDSTGELQLTDYGISGICTLCLSGLAIKNIDNNVSIKINFLPFVTDFESWIKEKMSLNRNIIESLEGTINYKLLYVLMKVAKMDNILLSKANINNLKNMLTNFKIKIIDHNGFNNAQVCQGGISLTEINDNCELKKIPNIYVTGEMLDVDGICGGYNLGFAWITGHIVGSDINDKSKTN